jgi:hypothetical protein
MRLFSALLGIAAVVVLVPGRVDASPVIFTDRAAFLSYHASLGLQPLDVETFDHPWWDINPVADVCRMQLTGLSIFHDCHDGAIGNGAGTFGYADFVYGRFSAGGPFYQPQTALGFDYQAFGVLPFNLGDLTVFLSGSGFFGVIDVSNPIQSMGVPPPVHLPGSGFLRMDNLSMRVPEPATSLLLGSSFLLLQAARHARKRRRLSSRLLKK